MMLFVASMMYYRKLCREEREKASKDLCHQAEMRGEGREPF